MKRIGTILAVVAVSGLSATLRADETTFCNFFITTLPYTISVQGHYCFDRNLATAITTGNAITVNSDFVVIDLTNFKLGGGSAGLTTTANGIFTNNHRNITVRNGNIRGFRIGIDFIGSSTGGHLIENNVLDGNTEIGVGVDGDTVIVRNNIVANTGGSTVMPYALGISSYVTQLVSVRDNVVSNTFATGYSLFDTTGIWTSGGGGQVIDHNVVRMGAAAGGATRGIDTSGGICRDDTTLNATAPNACTPVGANSP